MKRDVIALSAICLPAALLMLSPGLRREQPVLVSPAPPTVAQKYAPSVPMTKDFAVPVLMYHQICDLTPQEARNKLTFDLTVKPSDFDSQLRYLKAQGFTFLTARDVEAAIREGTALPEQSVVLTMDDGYQDNFAQAFPLLRKYGARATIFLVTNTVQTPGHLSWEEVQRMRPQVGYGSHTVHHLDLTQLPQPQLDYELVESKQVLEGRLGETVPHIAYPSGAYNERGRGPDAGGRVSGRMEEGWWAGDAGRRAAAAAARPGARMHDDGPVPADGLERGLCPARAGGKPGGPEAGPLPPGGVTTSPARLGGL